MAEFNLETDVKYAEQQIRDRVGAAKRLLPDEIEEPVVRRLDPAEQPVLILALNANLETAKLFDLADDVIRPRLEQVNQVGLVEIVGGRKREVKVELDRNKLRSHEISATQVASRLKAAGEDIPIGTVNESSKETVFRTLGQFTSIKEIEDSIVNFFGNDVPVRIKDVGSVSGFFG